MGGGLKAVARGRVDPVTEHDKHGWCSNGIMRDMKEL